MKKGKLLFIIVGLCTLIAMMTLCLTGCNQGKYFEQVSSYTFWENEGSESIAQTHVYDMVKEHMENENGKVKKVLVLGFDGTRAETMVNIRPSGVKDENGNDIYSGDNPKAKFSAVNYIVDDLGGKMYLAYAGGSNKDNFQATSTAPGWAAITTGCWGVENGVIDNPDAEKNTNIKNRKKKTFMLEYAEKGYNTTFMASWSAHRITYREEIMYVDVAQKPMDYYIPENDYLVHERLLSCVTEGSAYEKDVIFCIYDWADHNGHGSGFTNDNKNYVNAVRNNDNLMYEVIQQVVNREGYKNETEDWLIILTADHGGIKQWHGEQNPECRTTFIITNKPSLVKTEYYGKNYDGYEEN